MSPIKEAGYVCPTAVETANILLRAAKQARATGNEPKARYLVRKAKKHIQWDRFYHSTKT